MCSGFLRTLKSSLSQKSSLEKPKRGLFGKNISHSLKTSLNSLSFGISGESYDEKGFSSESVTQRENQKESFHLFNHFNKPLFFNAQVKAALILESQSAEKTKKTLHANLEAVDLELDSKGLREECSRSYQEKLKFKNRLIWGTVAIVTIGGASAIFPDLASAANVWARDSFGPVREGPAIYTGNDSVSDDPLYQEKNILKIRESRVTLLVREALEDAQTLNRPFKVAKEVGFAAAWGGVAFVALTVLPKVWRYGSFFQKYEKFWSLVNFS